MEYIGKSSEMGLMKYRLDAKEVGSRIRELRGPARQEELAEYLGISQGQLSKIEKGRVLPSLEIVAALGQRYKRSIDWITYGDE